jgi:hypothetical protein
MQGVHDTRVERGGALEATADGLPVVDNVRVSPPRGCDKELATALVESRSTSTSPEWLVPSVRPTH